MKQRIYYGDYSTYEAEQDPFFAPQTDVQVITFENRSERGFGIMQGKMGYYLRKGVWFACDEAGMWDYLMTYSGPKAVIFGRTREQDRFDAILNRAVAEGLG